ncbi:UDP-glucuronosyltransferase 1-3 isoform X1 [Agrilus planipennis]|uniref:UDP-glucuronosyltransferase 1-3 isoform X1 n=1 Tax=Agrilus planipennis TaxID=224129 RepID=A0A1W4WY61_AGRPL|nr:UDP-glucuronosyltransferase 1-3 isoform X1 [Agrilus planipennis]
MKTQTLCFILFIISQIECYKILVLFVHPGKSHFLAFEPLFKALAEKQHEITVVSYFPQKETIANYTDISPKSKVFTYTEEIVLGNYDGSWISTIKSALVLAEFSKISCKEHFSTKEVQNLIKSDVKFDVVIYEIFASDCLLGFAHKFKAPLIGVSTPGTVMPWAYDRVGNPSNPSFILNQFYNHYGPFDFSERLYNTILDVYTRTIYRLLTVPFDNEIIRKHFGNDVPDVQEIVMNTSMILLNSHFSLSQPFPQVPAIVEVCGVHIQNPKQLSQKTPSPGFIDISLKNTTNIGLEIIDVSQNKGSRLMKYLDIIFIDTFARQTCEASLKSEQVRQFINSTLDYDVVIAEVFNSNCFMTIAGKTKAPIVGVSSCYIPVFWNDIFGNPYNPSYIPNIDMDYSDNMTFFERVENLITITYTLFYFNFVSNSAVQSLVDKYAPHDQPIAEVSKNISLLLVNTHVTTARPRPFVPNIIEVGGIHLPSSVQQLPQNIEKWINESTHGVIYFSMGSMIKGHTFPEEKRNMFLRVFKRLPQRVLWKWESDMPGKPDNIMIQRWMPQYDILCHPNVKAFISHGGMLGTTETVQCGVPALVMPQFGDQFTNAKALEASGGGLIFDFWRDDEETLYNKLKQLLEPSFQQKAKQLSARFKDRPLPPLETAIYWVEYVARHGGAHHMRTAAVGMPLYKYLLLDVIAFLLAVITAILWITYRIVKFVGRKIIGQSIKVKTN